MVKQIAAHSLRVNAVALSTNGSWILSTSNDLLLRLWDRNTGEVLREQTINCRPDKLSLSEDGKLALFSCEGLIYLWDVQNWREQQRLLGHTAYINALDISSDGKVGLSAASDNTVRLWSLQGQFDYQTTDTGVHRCSGSGYQSGWQTSAAWGPSRLKCGMKVQSKQSKPIPALRGGYLQALSQSAQKAGTSLRLVECGLRPMYAVS
jgi:WD40 repeat protein